MVDKMLKKYLEQEWSSQVMADVSLTSHIEVTHAKDMGRHPRQRKWEREKAGQIQKNKWICLKTMGKSTNF